MNDLSPDERNVFLRKLINHYRPDIADAVIHCYENGLCDDDANAFLKEYDIKRTFNVHKSTSVYACQKGNSNFRKGESYRIWSEIEMNRHWKELCSVCLTTGIADTISDINWNR